MRMTNVCLMHGCGNKLILIDEYLNQQTDDKSNFVAQLCSEKQYSEVDSVLFFNIINDKKISMKVFDRDGSEETMCGNGIRCVARYFFDNYSKTDFVCIDTLAGTMKTKKIKRLIEVNMGSVQDFKMLDNNVYYVYINFSGLYNILLNPLPGIKS